MSDGETKKKGWGPDDPEDILADGLWKVMEGVPDDDGEPAKPWPTDEAWLARMRAKHEEPKPPRGD